MPTDVARPLRVLIIDHTAPVRSVRFRWDRLAAQSDCDLTLLSPTWWVENSSPTHYQPAEHEPYRVVLGRVVNAGDAVKSVYLTGLVKAFRTARPDVVVMMEEAFSLFAVQAWLARLLFAPGARVAFYACWILPYAEMFYRPRFVFRWLSRTMLRRLHAGMCINDRATHALRGAGFSNAITNFFGVDEHQFVPLDRGEARVQLGIGLDERVFLYAGRLLMLKGIQDLISAFELVARQRHTEQLRLVIVGAGEYEPHLRAISAESSVAGQIDFRGAIPNELVRTYMSAADAFVLPSRRDWHEQFGRVLAEAMLVGTPVVGSTSGEIPGVIRGGGFIFEADDVDALAATLEQVLDDGAEVARRVAIARSTALREYSVSAFVDRISTLIGELATSNAPRVAVPN